jgi:hypothetical protein
MKNGNIKDEVNLKNLLGQANDKYFTNYEEKEIEAV